MSDGGCEISINVPKWVPPAIAFGLSVVIAIAVCIAYVVREMERHKTFYGREDKLSAREEPGDAKKKEEMDAYALGRCSHEVLVIKSPTQTTPGAAPGTVQASGVKVMLRKRRVITKTPIKPPPLSVPTSLEPISPDVLNFAVIYDKTGRAFELIDLIRKEPPVVGSRSKRVDWLLTQIKNRLETMTDHHYIVYGTVDDQIWFVKGLENLQENVDETHLEMRLNVEALSLKVMAYKIQAISAEHAMMMSMRARTSDMLHPEPTQVTPSRWMALRGSTPEQTPHMTPAPQSRKRSAETLEPSRNKEIFLHAAKTLRQAMQLSPNPEAAHSFSSNPKAHGVSTDRKSVTRRSHMGGPKRAKSHGAKNSAVMNLSKSKELLYKARARVETTPPPKKTLTDSKESIDHHRIPAHHLNAPNRSPLPASNPFVEGNSNPPKAEEAKLSDAMTQPTQRKSEKSRDKESTSYAKEGKHQTITL